MKTEPNYFRKRRQSFAYAFAGIRNFLGHEPHARLHLAATILLLTVSLALKVSLTEAATLVGMVALVWVAEMFNTCIEKAMDFMSTANDPAIQFIKDVAAGAVLVASFAALVTALFIFIPKII